MKNVPIKILLVEDNQADADLVKEIVEENQLLTINAVKDGEEALCFLRKEGAYKDAPDVDLILLDLNLPRMDGRDVLKEIKSDPYLKRIPTVILTTSDAEQDIISSYELFANCYIKKPSSLDQFTNVLQFLSEFWTKVAQLPPNIRLGALHG